MLKALQILAVFLLAFMACKQTTNKEPVAVHAKTDSLPIAPKVPTDTIDHTAYPEIYQFLQALIRQHELDTSYGLIAEPYESCDLGLSDQQYLYRNLLKIPEKKKEVTPPPADSTDTITFLRNINLAPPPVLSLGPEPYLSFWDIRCMLRNKPDCKTFKWDNSRLGFNLANDTNYYRLSLPLFSANNKIAVMMVEVLCPGLCGSGATYVYQKNGKKWGHDGLANFWVH